MIRPQILEAVHTGIFQLLRTKEKNTLVLLNIQIKNNIVGEIVGILRIRVGKF